MIILSLVERDVAAMRRAILSAPEKADAIEVRLDALPHADPALLFEGSPRPLIAACRRKGDGGFYTGGERRRQEILMEAVRAGATWVDVEQGSGAEALAALGVENAAIGVILSRHDTRAMPRDGAALYRAMARVKGVRAIKLVGTASSPADCLLARDLLARPRKGPPLISFCMGEPGVLSRVMALEWGSWATYASLSPNRAAAPGQVTLPDLIGTYRIEEIDDDTCLTGIVGHPIGHSLSPAIHNAAYHAQGLDFRYVPLDIPTAAGLADLRRMARAVRLRGVSVTAPWKMAILKHLDAVEPMAASIGAVNTVLSDGRRLLGFNTDASGGMEALTEKLAAMGTSPAGMRVAIVGSGGAAHALAHAVARARMDVVIASRRQARGRGLARAVGGRWVAPGRLSREPYDVLINATPVGMSAHGAAPPAALPVTPAAVKGMLVYDVVYSPERTPLLKAAARKGIATLGGIEMLVRQAAEQYTLFTGRTAPLEVMREAATQEVGLLNGR